MKAIIIGATSGIGEALAEILAKEGYELGITGRRTEKLQAIKDRLTTKTYIQTMDVTNLEQSRADFLALADQMGGVDLVIVNAGVGWTTNKWAKEATIVATNISGCHAIFNAAFHYFSQKGGGHIVGISSIASQRGSGLSPAYSASKAFMSTYLEGLRFRSVRKKLNIAITDIRPGFVKTPMTEQNSKMFWVAPVNKAAKQIYHAIKAKKKVAYITKRWAIVAQLMKRIPDFFIQKTF